MTTAPANDPFAFPGLTPEQEAQWSAAQEARHTRLNQVKHAAADVIDRLSRNSAGSIGHATADIRDQLDTNPGDPTEFLIELAIEIGIQGIARADAASQTAATQNPVPGHSLPPNPYRRILAEIFADAEDHGLGTWGVTFQAAHGKTEEAARFIESRAALLAETRLA